MIEEGLAEKLKTDILDVSGRVYGGNAPQNAQAPHIVYARVGIQEDKTLCGTDSLVRGLFQFEIHAKTYKETKTIARAVKGSLRDYRGTLSDGTKVKDVSTDTETDLEPSTEPGLNMVLQTYYIWFIDRS